jgi:hypothetical protein
LSSRKPLAHARGSVTALFPTSGVPSRDRQGAVASLFPQPVRAACLSLLLLALPLAAQQRKLAIVNAALLEAEDGFAAPAGTVFTPGETLYLAFHVQGFTEDRSYKVKLGYRIEAVDPKGIPFVEALEGRVDTELSPQDAKWMPRVRFSASLPPFVDSGTYKFTMRVTDDLGKAQTSQELIFPVRGRDVPPSDTLVVRNFAFSRQEDGDPLPTAAFRPGDVLWAAFDLTGYKPGEKHRVAVLYNLAVLNSEGKVIYEQPEPAREEGTSFYPRRYVHAVFSLNLAQSPAGQYTIVLKTKDEIGSQSQESRHTFTVE